jgi:hypothetical protein
MSNEEKFFHKTISQMFNKFDSDELFSSKERNCEKIIEIYTFLNVMQLWTYRPRYSKLLQTIINKGYELLEEIDTSGVKHETTQKTKKAIHTVLRLVCCNKMVKGKYFKDRYCKRKKIDQYCTFHTNIKNKISTHMTEATESYLIKDITNIITNYISL